VEHDERSAGTRARVGDLDPTDIDVLHA